MSFLADAHDPSARSAGTSPSKTIGRKAMVTISHAAPAS